jgi:hypothetical protein
MPHGFSVGEQETRRFDMRGCVKVCFLLALLASASEVARGAIININDNTRFKVIFPQVTPGVLALCEYGVQNNACVPATGSSFGNTGISDYVIFSNFLFVTLATECSDPTPGDVNLPCPVDVTTLVPTKFLFETLPVNGVETVPYLPAPGEPGSGQSYKITSDTPEPASLLLMSTGIAALGASLRRRFSS